MSDQEFSSNLGSEVNCCDYAPVSPAEETPAGEWPPFCCPVHSRTALTAAGSDDVLSCLLCRAAYPVWEGIPRLAPDLNWTDDGLRAEAEQWDREAGEYEARRADDCRYMAGVEAAVRSLGAEGGDAVLDAGCGTGLTTRRLLDRGCYVTALDLSVKSLAYLRGRHTGGALRVVQGDLTSLPFAAGAFDRVLCANTLQHVPGDGARQLCVRELARVLRPGGRLVVTAQQHSIPRRWAGWVKEGPTGNRVRYIYRMSLGEFLRLMDGAAAPRVRGAGFPLPYRCKFGWASKRVERVLQTTGFVTAMADLLIGTVRLPDDQRRTPRS